jgi:hypothetical protein
MIHGPKKEKSHRFGAATLSVQSSSNISSLVSVVSITVLILISMTMPFLYCNFEPMGIHC